MAEFRLAVFVLLSVNNLHFYLQEVSLNINKQINKLDKLVIKTYTKLSFLFGSCSFQIFRVKSRIFPPVPMPIIADSANYQPENQVTPPLYLVCGAVPTVGNICSFSNPNRCNLSYLSIRFSLPGKEPQGHHVKMYACVDS